MPPMTSSDASQSHIYSYPFEKRSSLTKGILYALEWRFDECRWIAIKLKSTWNFPRRQVTKNSFDWFSCTVSRCSWILLILSLPFFPGWLIAMEEKQVTSLRMKLKHAGGLFYGHLSCAWLCSMIPRRISQSKTTAKLYLDAARYPHVSLSIMEAKKWKTLFHWERETKTKKTDTYFLQI